MAKVPAGERHPGVQAEGALRSGLPRGCRGLGGTLVGIDVLILCTANQCRSPMAEVLLRERLERTGLQVTVASAGERYVGVRAPGGAIRAMASRGLVLDEHRSRQIAVEELERADLVLGMARMHVRAAVVRSPGVFPRAFTLKELVRRGEAVGARRPDQSLGAWLGVLHAGRRSDELLGDDPADDVADPMGGSDADFEATARELESLLDRLVTLAFEPSGPVVAHPQPTREITSSPAERP